MERPAKSQIQGQANRSEAGLTAQDFPTRIGQALTIWAERNPVPNVLIEFIVPGGRKTLTPKGLAEEVVNRTPFGLERIEFYRDISRNLGDKSGERVIQDLVNSRET